MTDDVAHSDEIHDEPVAATLSARAKWVMRGTTGWGSVILVAIGIWIANDFRLGNDADPARSTAVLLFAPAVLAFIAACMRLLAHYWSKSVYSRELDGCGKYLAVIATSLVVTTSYPVVLG